MTLDNQYISQLDKISNNLKLSGDMLVPVLKKIYKNQPRRDRVERAVMELFPNKTAKSVFRGMVMPTTTRLHLVRSRSRKELVHTAPNGKASLAPDTPENREAVLRTVIRDYAVLVSGQTKESLEYLSRNKNQIREHDPNIAEKASRFKRSFLDEFDVELPSAQDLSEKPVYDLYIEQGVIDYVTSENMRRMWIRRALPKHQFQQIERVRWKMIQYLQEENTYVSSWFVDEALRREWMSDNPIIDLWKSSTHSDRKLKSGNDSYEAAVLTEDDD